MHVKRVCMDKRLSCLLSRLQGGLIPRFGQNEAVNSEFLDK